MSAPPAPSTRGVAAGGRTSTRERVAVKRLAETQTPQKIVEEWTPPVGKGMAMKDLEHCAKYINKLVRNDERLQALHKIFYGRRGLKATIKPNCMNFSGLVYDDHRTRESVVEKLYQWTAPMLKLVMDLFGIDRSSTTGAVDKEGLAGRFCDWLESPSVGKSKKAAAKQTKKAKALTKKFKKAMSLDKNRPKKGMSAYIFLPSPRIACPICS